MSGQSPQVGIDYPGVAVTFYCHDGKGNWLLQKRSQNCRDEQGHWDCGGGKLELGEELESAVLRELMEEYGCQGTIQTQLPALSRLRESKGQKTHWISVAYLVQVDPDLVVNSEPDYIDELGWFQLDQFPEPLHSTVRLRLEQHPELFRSISTTK